MGKNKKSKGKASPSVVTPPPNFKTTIQDMCKDLSNTFPEYANLWSQWCLEEDAIPEGVWTDLFQYCLRVFPERFFDILYKNEDMFGTESTVSTTFLPGVDFKVLYNLDGVTDGTKTSIWNYLQLILFTVVGSVRDKSHFGETGNIFDGINETDLFEKITETMQNMSAFFGEDGDSTNEEGHEKTTETPPQEGYSMPKMPDIKAIHEHLQGLFDGKIGKMARELAESISGDLSSILGDEAKDVKSNQDVLKILMKNPARIQQLIKLIGEKVKDKLNSGEVDQDQMMKEAVDILSKFKDMGGGGGMDGLKQMFEQMGMGGAIPKGARMDMSKLDRMTSFQRTKERLKKRAMEKQAAAAALAVLSQQQQAQQQPQAITNDHMSEAELDALSKQFGLDLKEDVSSKPTKSGGKKKSKK
jgi:hypothetical protein